MIAAGKSKFWKIKTKEESNYIRIEYKLAQIDLELRDPRTSGDIKRVCSRHLEYGVSKKLSVDPRKALYFASHRMAQESNIVF